MGSSTSVSGAAVAPDGTPYFVQWHTNAVNVFRGVNGDVSQNAYSTCCGYNASVAPIPELYPDGAVQRLPPAARWSYNRRAGPASLPRRFE